MFVSANKFCGCWLKKFWSIRKALPFVTPSRFRKHKRVLPRADRQRLKPCLRRPLNHQVIYCVRGVITPPCGTPFFPVAFTIILRRCITSPSCILCATFSNSSECCTLSKSAEIDVDDSGLLLDDCLCYTVYRFMCGSFRSISIRFRLKVSFE